MDIESIAIVGPTASGKTQLAVRVMKRWPVFEVVSVDSMTIYKEFAVGTAKPTDEELQGLPYHLISLISIQEEFSLGSFLRIVDVLRTELKNRGRHALFVGGTSLYLRAVVDGVLPPPRYLGLRSWLETLGAYVDPGYIYILLKAVDPKAASKIEKNNVRRSIRALEVALGSGGLRSVHGEVFSKTTSSKTIQFGIDLPRDLLYQRIEERIKVQLSSGWIDEVEGILKSGVQFSRTAAQAIGYREFASYLRGEITLEEAVESTIVRTRNLAKRQLAWLRRDERILWANGSEEVFDLISKSL